MNAFSKRIVAGLAAAATLVAGMAMGTGAMAADNEATLYSNDIKTAQKLEVKASAGDLTGKDLVAVKLASYSAVRYNTEDKTISGYDVVTVDALKDAIYAAAKADTVASTTGNTKDALSQDNPMEWVVENLLDSTTSPYAGQLRNFLNELKNNDTVKQAAGTTLTADAEGATASADVEPGIYVIFDKTTGTTNTVSIPMMNGTTVEGMNLKSEALGDVEYKAGKPTVDKNITAGGTVASDHKKNDIAADKDITYELSTKVPNWTGYDSYYLALHDTLSEGLTLNADSFTVKVGDTTLEADEDYTLAVNGQSFDIYFADFEGTHESNILKDEDTRTLYAVDAPITVTYTAKLNGKAVIDDETGNTNTVNLEYSNNPNETSHGKTEDITVHSYTGALTLNKTDANGNPLQGAKFAIYEGESADGEAMKFVLNDDGQYVPSSDANATDVIDLTNATTATIKGLDGTYTVKETYSPYTGASVNLSFKVVVTVDQETGEYTVTATPDINKLVSNVSAENNKAVNVMNVKNITEMPKTGATWLAIYAVAALLLAGGSLLLGRSKKRA